MPALILLIIWFNHASKKAEAKEKILAASRAVPPAYALANLDRVPDYAPAHTTESELEREGTGNDRHDGDGETPPDYANHGATELVHDSGATGNAVHDVAGSTPPDYESHGTTVVTQIRGGADDTR